MKTNEIAIIRNDKYDFYNILGLPAVYFHQIVARENGSNFYLLVPDDKYEKYSRVFDEGVVFTFSKEKELYNLIEDAPTLVKLNNIHIKPTPDLFEKQGRCLKYIIASKKSFKDTLFIDAMNSVSEPTLEEKESCIVLDSEFDLLNLRKWIGRIINCKMMRNGVSFQDIDGATIGPLVTIEAGVELRNKVTLLGNIYIEKGSILEDNVKIVNSRIGKDNYIFRTFMSNSTVGDNNIIRTAYVEDSVVGNKNEIGPFVHLRGQTIVSNGALIGNFVEIKGSQVDESAKIKHHAYIGDTFVGKNANIGCGVITANYDGINKHKTYIGERSFIGCNTTLVAPITINKDCYIAAGSTITEDVETGDLAIARTRQVNKKGYAIAKGLKKA